VRGDLSALLIERQPYCFCVSAIYGGEKAVYPSFVIFMDSTSRGRDPLPRLLDGAIDILLLAIAIAFVREITRSKSMPRFAFWDAVSQSVDSIGEVTTVRL